MILDNFIVFEGIDGAGTTTQLQLLAAQCTPDIVTTTCEPTDGAIGRFIRSALAGSLQFDERTMAYLFAADRAEHVYGRGGILAQCAHGKLVVCDRYLFSSLAYQSLTGDPALPALLNDPFPLPALLFYFKIDVASALERVARRGGPKERYDSSAAQTAVAAAYERVIAEYTGTEKGRGMRVVTIDARERAEKIAQIIWNEVQNLPILKK
ncbi:MAG: dTMP kinase [Treponema sp.]|nr:dTMP kinase [Treponema sp.]